MKNGIRNSILNQITKKEIVLTGLLAFFVLATVLFPLGNLERITVSGNEKQYWGIAMSLLGQDWANYLNSESMTGIGYSLVLLPICMLAENSVLAYKAAIIFNGCIWTISYVVSVCVAKKIINTNSCFLSIGCFSISLFPIYADSKMYIGPDALLYLLFWLAVGLIYDFYKEGSKGKLMWLAVDIIISIWLAPIMISFAIGSGLFLLFALQRKKIEEVLLMKWIFLVLLGCLAGNITEQLLFYKIFSGKNIIYSIGIQVLIERIISNWTNKGIVGCLFSIISKFYSVCVNTLGFILPVFFLFYKEYKLIKTKKESAIIVYLSFIFISVFFITGLSYMGNNEGIDISYFNLGMIPIIVGPLLLIAMDFIWKMKKHSYGIWICVLTLFLTTILLVSPTEIFHPLEVEDFGENSGILSIFQEEGKTLSENLILMAVAVIFIFLILATLLFAKNHTSQKGRLIIGALCPLILIGCAGWMNYGIYAKKVWKENIFLSNKYQSVASILQRTSGDLYYLASDTEEPEQEDDIYALQMLLGRKDLHWISDDKNEQEKLWSEIVKNKNKIGIITKGDYRILGKKLEEYELLYLTKDIAIWGCSGSQMENEIEKLVCKQEEKAEKVKDGSRKIYGDGVYLSPGTYVVKYTFKVKTDKENQSIGKIAIKDNYTTFQVMDIGIDQIQNKNYVALEVPFTSNRVLENVRFQINQRSGSKISEVQVSYQKQSNEYCLAMNDCTDMDSILSTITNLNEKTNSQGKVGYVSNEKGSTDYIKQIQNADHIMMEHVGIDKVEGFDYLIFRTEPKEYYDLLEKYEILKINSEYTLLALSDSIQAKIVREQQGFSYSNKRKLDIRCFLNEKEDGTYGTQLPINLPSGVYSYIVNLELKENQRGQDKLGKIVLTSGEEILESVNLVASQFNQQNKYMLEIPIISPENISDLKIELEENQGVQLEAIPYAIELQRKSFSIGVDDSDGIQRFAEIINNCNLDLETKMVYMIDDSSDYEKQDDLFEYIHSLLPKTQLEMKKYHSLMDSNGDFFVLTRGYSPLYFELAKKYTIVASSASYLLWTSSEGNLLEQAVWHGGTVLSQNTKIAADCLIQLQKEDSISYLSSGNYKIYMSLELYDQEDYDTIEVGLSRDKTENELQEEIKELQDWNYTKSEIESLLDPVTYTDTETYSTRDFENGTLVTSVFIRCPKETMHLRPLCFSQKGSKIKATITWIELL